MRYFTISQAATAAPSGGFFGSVFDMRSIQTLSVFVSASGAATGSTQLQVTDAPLGNPLGSAIASSSNWVAVTSASASITGANGGVFLIPATTVCYTQGRVWFSGAAGSTGSLAFNIKGYGY